MTEPVVDPVVEPAPQPAPNLRERATYLGSSDAAGILGLSPWATPLDIYYRKVGYPGGQPPIPDPQRERILRRGKLMEPVVIEMMRAEYPIEITRISTPENPNRYQDEEFPFMAAEIDFEWRVTEEMQELFPKFQALPVGSIQNGEVKTVHPFAASEWGEAESDEIPIHYAVQSMHAMGVKRRQACLFALLIGSDNLTPYQIMAEDAILLPMRKRLAEFWIKHVLPRIPPEPVNLPDVYRMLRIKRDTEVQANADLMKLVGLLKEQKEQMKNIEEGIKDTQFKIGTQVLGAESLETKTMTNRHRIMKGAGTLLTIALKNRGSINTELLEESYPEAYEACHRNSTFFEYRFPRKKL